MLVIVVILFAVCWLPLNTYHLVVDFSSPVGPSRHSSTVFFVCHWLAMSSVCYNPFIYFWLNDHFRAGARSWLSCAGKKLSRLCGRVARRESQDGDENDLSINQGGLFTLGSVTTNQEALSSSSSAINCVPLSFCKHTESQRSSRHDPRAFGSKATSSIQSLNKTTIFFHNNNNDFGSTAIAQSIHIPLNELISMPITKETSSTKNKTANFFQKRTKNPNKPLKRPVSFSSSTTCSSLPKKHVRHSHNSGSNHNFKPYSVSSNHLKSIAVIRNTKFKTSQVPFEENTSNFRCLKPDEISRSVDAKGRTCYRDSFIQRKDSDFALHPNLRSGRKFLSFNNKDRIKTQRSSDYPSCHTNKIDGKLETKSSFDVSHPYSSLKYLPENNMFFYKFHKTSNQTVYHFNTCEDYEKPRMYTKTSNSNQYLLKNSIHNSTNISTDNVIQIHRSNENNSDNTISSFYAKYRRHSVPDGLSSNCSRGTRHRQCHGHNTLSTVTRRSNAFKLRHDSKSHGLVRYLSVSAPLLVTSYMT